MSSEGLSEREQQIIIHLERAQSLDVSLKEYAEAYSLDVRDLYYGKSQLVKKGVLPGRAASDGAEEFVAVRVAPSARAAVGCRMTHPSGWTIEFAGIPEPSWINALMAGAADAAA